MMSRRVLIALFKLATGRLAPLTNRVLGIYYIRPDQQVPGEYLLRKCIKRRCATGTEAKLPELGDAGEPIRQTDLLLVPRTHYVGLHFLTDCRNLIVVAVLAEVLAQRLKETADLSRRLRTDSRVRSAKMRGNIFQRACSVAVTTRQVPGDRIDVLVGIDLGIKLIIPEEEPDSIVRQGGHGFPQSIWEGTRGKTQ